MRRSTLIALTLLAASLLVACSPEDTGPVIEQLGGGTEERSGRFSGFIEADEVVVSPELGGRVVDLLVEEGDTVEAGDVLLRLDTSLLEAQRQIAVARRDIIQAERDLAAAGPRDEIIAQAEAQVTIAMAALEAAQVALGGAAAVRNNPQDIRVQVVEAETQVAVALQEVAAAESQLRSAERAAELYYSALEDIPEIEERFGIDLPDPDYRTPIRLEQAWASFTLANESLVGAQNVLSAFQDLANNPAGLSIGVAEAQAGVSQAEAALETARASLDDLKAGIPDEDLAIFDARLEQAEAAIASIDVQIERFTVTAPISGIVLEQSINAGELAAPNRPVITLADLETVELRIYVTTLDRQFVSLNDEVEVSIDSGDTFIGEVSFIAQEAEFTPRNIQTEDERVNLVYEVRVRIDNPDLLLKPGIPADAQLDVE
ncbi:MAG: HlyD family efflux transporter periplasmic adaptor subunit [Chloroflexi bacterium]|nr:HlyD family efflux transporter periplasmic adaptor subunit [Chloroflexota bacterium]